VPSVQRIVRTPASMSEVTVQLTPSRPVGTVARVPSLHTITRWPASSSVIEHVVPGDPGDPGDPGEPASPFSPFRIVTVVPSGQRMVAVPSAFCSTLQTVPEGVPSSEQPAATAAQPSITAATFLNLSTPMTNVTSALDPKGSAPLHGPCEADAPRQSRAPTRSPCATDSHACTKGAHDGRAEGAWVRRGRA